MEDIVIVGAGPAGLMLAYQLASNGLGVRVFERHKDFEREFRGEFAQPSLLTALEQLGVLSVLREGERLVPIRAVRMHHRGRPFASNVGRDGEPAGYAVHQPSFLRLLHERCSRFPGYELTLGAPVTRLFREEGRVRGVVARIEGREQEVVARLVVVCNGRASALRKEAELEAEELSPPHSLLWLRFDLSRTPELCPDVLEGFITERAFCVLYPTYGKKAQLMWRRSRKYPLDWKSPIATLKPALISDAPEKWHSIIGTAMNEDVERQVLQVRCDRLRRWSAPGVLFLGDAAHTMSAVGGLGLTMAVRDAIVAANHVIRAHRAGRELEPALLASIETERRPEVEKMQAFQQRADRINDAPPPVQWLMAKVIVPLVTRMQGQSYLRELQHGVSNVSVEFPVSD